MAILVKIIDTQGVEHIHMTTDENILFSEKK
jgi:hypothetical protein